MKSTKIPQKAVNNAVDQILLILCNKDEIDSLIENNISDLPLELKVEISSCLQNIFADLRVQVLKEVSEYYKKEEEEK